jgi:hypothetical protein
MIGPADHLDMLRALGGQVVTCAAGQFVAILENEFLEADGVEGRTPVLTCRTVDVQQLQIGAKGAVLQVGGDTYRVRRHEPAGDGESRLILGG